MKGCIPKNEEKCNDRYGKGDHKGNFIKVIFIIWGERVGTAIKWKKECFGNNLTQLRMKVVCVMFWLLLTHQLYYWCLKQSETCIAISHTLSPEGSRIDHHFLIICFKGLFLIASIKLRKDSWLYLSFADGRTGREKSLQYLVMFWFQILPILILLFTVFIQWCTGVDLINKSHP